MDIIYLNHLQVETVIGVYEWERHMRQTVVIDLEMGCDIRKATSSDSIEDTLDYKAVAKRVIAVTESSRFQLVETLAGNLADMLMREFRLPWLRLRVTKPGAVRQVRDVGVIVERGKRD